MDKYWPYLTFALVVVFMGESNVCLNFGNLCILIQLAIFDLNRYYTTIILAIHQKPDKDSIYIVYILVELIIK